MRPQMSFFELLTDQDQEPKVISTVGFGGLGEITLSTKVNRKIEGQFTYHAFVYVCLKAEIPDLLHNLFFKLNKEQSPHKESWMT